MTTDTVSMWPPCFLCLSTTVELYYIEISSVYIFGTASQYRHRGHPADICIILYIVFKYTGATIEVINEH